MVDQSSSSQSAPALDSSQSSSPPANDASGSPVDLDSLVGQWWDWNTCADALGIPASRVQQLVKEHQLAAAAVGGFRKRVPADFIAAGEVVKGVSGVLTVLHDGGYSDEESITWLFTADETLPGRPIDALIENRGAEVKRRAQSMAL